MAKRAKGEERLIINKELQPKLDKGMQEYKNLLTKYIDKLGKVKFQSPFDGRTKIIIDASARFGYDIGALYHSGMTNEELESLCVPKKVITYTFESKLETHHLEALLPVVNDLVFVEPQTVDSLRDLFECKKKHVRVKSNGILAYMMYLLSAYEWICQNWQMVAKSQETFASKKGVTLSHSNLSRSLHMMAKRMNYPADKQGIRQLNTELYETVKGLKR